MMGPWTIRETAMSVGAGLLLCSICYFVGKHNGQLDEILAENKTAIHASDTTTKSVQIRTDSAHNRSDLLTDNRATLRAHIGVVHDTILLPAGINQSKDSIIAVSPEIAQLIEADDSTIKALQRTVALQDTLIASLRVGLNLRDTRIKLLESEVTPGKFKRLITATKWIAVGAAIGVAYQRR